MLKVRLSGVISKETDSYSLHANQLGDEGAKIIAEALMHQNNKVQLLE